MFQGLIGLVSKTLTIAILANPTSVTIQQSSAQARHSGPQIFYGAGYEMGPTPFDEQLPKNLHWTPNQIADAKMVIEATKKNLQTVVDNFKSLGADRIVSSPDALLSTPETANLIQDILAGYPKLQSDTNFMLAWDYKMWAYQGDKKVSGEVKRIWPQELHEGKEWSLAERMVTLNSTDCSLREFHWFNPFTWFIGETCKISAPSARKYLKAELLSKLAQHFNPSDVTDLFPTQELDILTSKRIPYVINDDKIAPTTAAGRANFYNGYIQLPNWARGYGYKLTLGGNPWDLSFNVVWPTIQEVADHVAMQESEEFNQPPQFTIWSGDWTGTY